MQLQINGPHIKSATSTILAVLVSFALFSCAGNSQKFKSKQAAPTDNKKTPAETDRGGKKDGADTTVSPKASAGTEILQTAQELCAQQGKVVRVFVLDLKSGWFAGDGGAFFKSFVDSKCNDKLEISYVHITKARIDSNLNSISGGKVLLPCFQSTTTKHEFQTQNCRFGSFSGFEQVWILSGSSGDDQDLDLNGPLFNNIRQNLVDAVNSNPKLSLFFSAGLSNIDHSNALAKAALPGFEERIFSRNPEFPAGTLPSSDYPSHFKSQALVAGSGKTVGTIDTTHLLFKGVSELYDYTTAEKTFAGGWSIGSPTESTFGKCLGDAIVSTKLPIIATDHCNRPIIASGKIGTHKVILEGNTARFYGTKPEEYYFRLISALLP